MAAGLTKGFVAGRTRVIGLSKLGKVSAAVAAGGAAYAAVKHRKAVKRGYRKAKRTVSEFRYGARNPLLGPLKYERRKEKQRLRDAGKSTRNVGLPAKIERKALRYGTAGVVAGEVAGPLAAGISGRLFGEKYGPAAVIAGHGVGRAAAYGASLNAYAASRRSRLKQERAAARASKSGSGAASAG